MAATNANSHPSARPPAKPARSSEESYAVKLADKIARLHAGLNPNPAARPAPAANSSQTSKAKKTPVSTIGQARNYLRATNTPAHRFLRRAPDIRRHSRKCAICHHPEREAIEELFIHWHSPQAISEFFDQDETITWLAIYRHAYALGLDAIRRRNLGFVFERVLDNASDAAPTSAGVVAAARALGSCVKGNGRWTDPVKRVILTTIVRKDDPDSISSTDPESAQPSAGNRPPLQNQGKPDKAEPHRGALIPASLPPCLSASSSGEIRHPHNSHATKDKRISNR